MNAASFFDFGNTLSYKELNEAGGEFSQKTWSEMQKEYSGDDFLFRYLFNSEYICAILKTLGLKHSILEVENSSWAPGAAVYLYFNNFDQNQNQRDLLLMSLSR
ncbi:MAG TPA: hypothetical protein DD381_12300 [Lentisphaeria bacterium]|nr:MAG: hypothetical protein A2X47_09435 [Lentisphaerae bacterium GWF2_38_69]HBM17107.1 hypothetical protein [Lentisphaeria bacterium]